MKRDPLECAGGALGGLAKGAAQPGTAPAGLRGTAAAIQLSCSPATTPSPTPQLPTTPPGLNLAEAMERARVLDFELQKQLVPYMRDTVPLPGIYDPAFIAANQVRCWWRWRGRGVLSSALVFSFPLLSLPDCVVLLPAEEGCCWLYVGMPVCVLCCQAAAELALRCLDLHALTPRAVARCAAQAERADNIIKGSKAEQMETIRQHIRAFKQEKQVCV